MNNSPDNFRWVLVYSPIAFLALTLHQAYVVIMSTPAMLKLYAGFGAALPAQTVFAANWYWLGCVVTVAVSAVTAAAIGLKADTSPPAVLKKWYLLSIASVVAALLWSAFVLTAVYKPVLELGASV